MGASEVSCSSRALGGTSGQGPPGSGGLGTSPPLTVADLCSTLCSALQALVRQEMELARQGQAEAAERREENMRRLLAEQEHRLLAALLQAAEPRARPPGPEAAGYSLSPSGSTCRRSPGESPVPHAGLRLPLRGRGRSQSPVLLSRNRSQRSLSSRSGAAGRTPWNVLTEDLLPTLRGAGSSPGGQDEEPPRDVEAVRTPYADMAHGMSGHFDETGSRAATDGQVSLNSPSPAGTREWRHHVKGRITQKISRGSKRTRIRMSMGKIGTRLDGLVGRLWSEDSSMKSARRRWSEGVVDSMRFEMLCGIVILANAIAIGWRQDALIRDAMGGAGGHFCHTCADVVNYLLVLVFVLEIAFRIYAKRLRYFFGREWKWNVADSVLATYCIIEFAASRTYKPYFQIVRTLRLVRVVRAIRSVRVFRDVRLMVCSLSQSLVPLFSAFALLFGVIYVFSICFMYGATIYVEQVGARADVVSELRRNYGKLSTTMYTLLLAISNGRDWNELAAPLCQIHWGFQALFMFYVLFVVIGVLNVLTSIFVERARELSKLDRDLATQGELASQEAFITQMRTIFEEVDDEKYGRITWQKFRDYLRSDRAQAFLATQQLDTSDAARLFSLMEVDDAGAVSVEEFALGCMRLRGPAKSSDVALLLREAKVGRKNAKMLFRLGVRLDRLCRILGIPSLDDGAGAPPSGSLLSARSATAPHPG